MGEGSCGEEMLWGGYGDVNLGQVEGHGRRRARQTHKCSGGDGGHWNGAQ